jgi:hypothetical protein
VGAVLDDGLPEVPGTKDGIGHLLYNFSHSGGPAPHGVDLLHGPGLGIDVLAEAVGRLEVAAGMKFHLFAPFGLVLIETPRLRMVLGLPVELKGARLPGLHCVALAVENSRCESRGKSHAEGSALVILGEDVVVEEGGGDALPGRLAFVQYRPPYPRHATVKILLCYRS